MFNELRCALRQRRQVNRCRKCLTTLKDNLTAAKKRVLAANNPENRQKEREDLLYNMDIMLKRTNLCLSILEEDSDYTSAIKKIRTVFSYVEGQYVELQRAAELFCSEGDS